MNSRAYEIVKLFVINGLMIFVVLNLIYWSIPILQFMIGRSPPATPDLSARFPNYANVDWADLHFREMEQIQFRPAPTDFKSFIGWRRRPFSGQTINVEGPYGQRRTINKATDGAKTAYFFGGSTMWGTGANDVGTIPSQFASLIGVRSENLGEAGYTAHQNLMLLIQLLQDGRRPDLVVFYDGINEVLIKCVTELTPDAHMLEDRINTLLKAPAISPVSFTHYLAPIWHVGWRVKSTLAGATDVAPTPPFNCHLTPDKATRIADNVLRDWQMAKRVAESYGATFIGILQPVIYFSRSKRDHLVEMPVLMNEQFDVVYPLIKQRMAGTSGLHDFASVLDAPDEYVYVDPAHLSPNGNHSVATRIAEVAGSLGIGR